MSDFTKSLSLSQLGQRAWELALQQHFGTLTIACINMEDNTRYQKCKYGDVLLILDDPERPFLRVELKVREYRWFEQFKRDGLLFFEIQGNETLNRAGSSIFTSKADIWTNGYLSGDRVNLSPRIEAPTLFWLRELRHFLHCNT